MARKKEHKWGKGEDIVTAVVFGYQSPHDSMCNLIENEKHASSHGNTHLFPKGFKEGVHISTGGGGGLPFAARHRPSTLVFVCVFRRLCFGVGWAQVHVMCFFVHFHFDTIVSAKRHPQGHVR
jgi:hypothetical protein